MTTKDYDDLTLPPYLDRRHPDCAAKPPTGNPVPTSMLFSPRKSSITPEERTLPPCPASLAAIYPVGPGADEIRARMQAKANGTDNQKPVAAKPTPQVETVKPKAAKVKSAPKARKPKGEDKRVIRVLTTDFGHKPGSKAETKSKALQDGMTVAEYMANNLGIPGNWHMGHINHCLGKGFIKLDDPS